MKWLTTSLLLLYPVLVLLGVQQWSPRVVGLVVVAVYCLHIVLQCRRQWQRLGALVVALVLAALLWTANSALLLRLFPSAISLMLCAHFAYGAWVPPSLPGRMAALHHRVPYRDLDPRIQQYTRKVALVWSLFLLANAIVAAILAVCFSDVIWAMYTGLLAYLAIAALFALEYGYRRWIFYRQIGL